MRNVTKNAYHQHVFISIQKRKAYMKNLATLQYIGSLAKFAGTN